MRVLFISQSLGDAYGQERIMRLSNDLLRANGCQTFFLAEQLTGSPPDSDGFQLVPGLSSLNSLSSSRQISTVTRSLAESLFKLKPDIVHFIDQLDPHVTQLVTKQFPTVFTAHTVAPTCPSSQRFIQSGVCEQSSGWLCLLHQSKKQCLTQFKTRFHQAHVVWEFQRKKRALSSFTLIGAISSYVKNCLIRDGIPEQKIRYLFNPVSTDHPLPNPPALVPPNLLVVASRLVKLKGIDILVKELHQIRNEPWTLWIFGDGPERNKLEALCSSLNLSHKVIFKGRRPQTEIQQALLSAKVFIQPNQGPEGFGMAVAEASNLGVPVIAYDVPALDEIIEPEQTGLLIPLNEPGSLSRAIVRVTQSNELQQSSKEAGPKRMQERYSLARHLNQTLETYQECVRLFKESSQLRA